MPAATKQTMQVFHLVKVSQSAFDRNNRHVKTSNLRQRQKMNISDYPQHTQYARYYDNDLGPDYPEKYLPQSLLAEIEERREWRDESGFSWGWNVMGAFRDDLGPYIVVANKYEGQGYHHQKVYRKGVGVVDKFVCG